MAANQDDIRNDLSDEDGEDELANGVDEVELNPLEGDEEDDDDDDENPLAHLPGYILARVERLKSLDEQRESLMTTYLEERAALELKYETLCKPLYDDRAAVACGEKDGEISQDAAADVAEDASPEDPGPPVKGIPQFWIAAMTNCETIGEVVAEEDVDIFEKLQNITCVQDDDGKGFALRFQFAPNDYFHDTVLTKQYKVPNLLLSDEPILKNVSGCKIQWKKDMSLTFRTVQKKQRGKGKNAGQVRSVSKTERRESFFHWFDPPEMPPMDQMDEEQAERLEEEFDSDYGIAQAFRCDIVPKAVLWFTGEVRSNSSYSKKCSENPAWLTQTRYPFVGCIRRNGRCHGRRRIVRYPTRPNTEVTWLQGWFELTSMPAPPIHRLKVVNCVQLETSIVF